MLRTPCIAIIVLCLGALNAFGAAGPAAAASRGHAVKVTSCGTMHALTIQDVLTPYKVTASGISCPAAKRFARRNINAWIPHGPYPAPKGWKVTAHSGVITFRHGSQTIVATIQKFACGNCD